MTCGRSRSRSARRCREIKASEQLSPEAFLRARLQRALDLRSGGTHSVRKMSVHVVAGSFLAPIHQLHVSVWAARSLQLESLQAAIRSCFRPGLRQLVHGVDLECVWVIGIPVVMYACHLSTDAFPAIISRARFRIQMTLSTIDGDGTMLHCYVRRIETPGPGSECRPCTVLPTPTACD